MQTVSVRARALVLTAFGVLTLAVGCHDRSSQPTPAEYVLYAGVHSDGTRDSHGYIVAIDCQADTVIDSFPVPSGFVGSMTASPDGNYLATNARQMWDAKTRTLLATLSLPFLGEVFLPGGREFFAPHFDSTEILALPGFERLAVLDVEMLDGSVVPGQPLVIGIDNRGHHETPGPNLLRILNYKTRQLVDSIIIAPDPGEEAASIGKIVVSPDGKRLYAMAVTARGDQLIGYDLERREVLFRRGVYSYWGFCRVTPDGHEVWLTDASELGYPDLWPPYIIILDARTGTGVDSIDMRGFYPDSILGYEHRSLEPQDIRFHPNGEKAYVFCGRYFNGHRQPLLVIDTRERKVIKTLLDLRMWHNSVYDFEYLVESIDIGPKP